jgi:O-antigen ligase
LTGVIFLSVLFSQYRVISLIAFIAKTLQGVALVLVITDNIKKRWHLVAFISALVAISVLVALSAIYQYVDGVDFLRGNILFGGRSAACFRHPNDLGAFLVLPLMTCFGLLLVIKRPWFKYVIIAVIGLVAAALLFTFSRSSWLGFLCAMGMFILLKPRFWKLAIILIVWAYASG